MNDGQQRNTEIPLCEIQRKFLGAIAEPLEEDLAAAEANIVEVYTRNIADMFVTPSHEMSAKERLTIYRRQYWYRLLDCLYDDFPGLRTIVGESRFRALSVAYLQGYPSKSFSLRDLGCNLAKFLSEAPHWLGRARRLGLEMVQFEWAQIVAFDGCALPVLLPAQVAQIQDRGLRVVLQPYITLLELSYELDDFHISLRTAEHFRSEAVSPERKRRDGDSKSYKPPRRKRTYLVVHRYQNSVYYKRLSRQAFQLLLKVQQGADLTEACAEVLGKATASAQNPEKAAREIQTWFSEWSALGWFALSQTN